MSEKNTQKDRLSVINSQLDKGEFLLLNEEISFGEYIDKLYENPRLIRTAYQRLYDMITSKGVTKTEKYRRTYVHYNFFDESEVPIFGLEETLDELLKVFRGAAGGYGTEKRIILLHGPVGSSKSTICRALKRGLERYSRTAEGAWYTYKWVNLPTGQEDGLYTHKEDICPMHDDPLRLIPIPTRNNLIAELNGILFEQTPAEEKNTVYTLKCDGELNPRCKKFMDELLLKYDGDWKKVIDNHIRVVRKVYSETDRMGIATFQPKDEKNQDATELTGDINYARLPSYGSDSDPRAFNFDGEFCVANRGFFELIEVLKLDQAFLYDLLGASQEQQIKPKKFSQIYIDEVLVGHSVHEDTPIPHLYDGVLDVLPISELSNLEVGKLQVFSVNEDTKEVELTPVKNVFSHDFEGDWVENHQDDDVLVTTPNHSVYKETEDGSLQTFYPGDDVESEIYRVELPLDIILNYPKTERWENFFNNKENNPEYCEQCAI